MTINLYDILSVEGKTNEYTVALDVFNQTFRGEPLVISLKEPFKLTIHRAAKDILNIEGKAFLNVSRICARCLEQVECEYIISINEKVNVSKRIVYDESLKDDDSDYDDFEDEISYIEDCTLDVDKLILDELYAVFPMSVLCSEDCKGICKVCGINLNINTCDCDQTVPDPRMAVFSDVFKQFTVSDDTDMK